MDKISQKSKKIQTELKFPRITSKLTKLHLLKNNNLVNKVARQDIRAISAQKLVFGSPSLELRIVFKILQEINLLAQEAFRVRLDKQLLGDTGTELSPPKQDVVQNTGNQSNVNNNVMKR